MNKTIKSIIHRLSIMSIEQIEQLKIAIEKEPSFNKIQKTDFMLLCDFAIEERRRHQGGEGKI